jgi:hypothetical protein
VNEIPTLGLLEQVAVLELSIVFREAYNISILHVWYLSIDIHCILLHVDFEDMLFITVLRNRATRYKLRSWEIENISKKPMVSNPDTLHFFKLFVFVVGRDLAHWCMSEFQR